jgi:hypothetical protein
MLPPMDLDRDEARRVHNLLFGESEGEARLLLLVRDGRTVQAVRTDTGPLRAFSPELHAGGLEEAQAAAGDLGRVVALEAEASPGSMLEGLLAGTLRAEPPWIPAIERFRRLPSLVRRGLARLIPDGAYGFALTDPGLAVCARLRSGRVERVYGATVLGVDARDLDSTDLEALLRRVGRPRLALTGSARALRSVLASPRPATALDRATIRQEIATVGSSLRVKLALVLFRLFGG